MLNQIIVSSLLLADASLVSAFPHIAEKVANLNHLNPRDEPEAFKKFPEFPGRPKHATFDKFDLKDQTVSTSGIHRFIKPKKTDIRGPCAGLNAAANHGYLPRDGIATSKSINHGLFEAFGLALDATEVLETLTRFFDGDPISGRWSIGPPSDKTYSFPLLQGVLGNETGICEYGHLKTEGDASITRGDWLAPTQNSNCYTYPEFTEQLFDLANKRTGGHLTPRVMAEHQYNRKRHSIATNPYYFSPPYAGVAFTFGAHMFAYELIANRSKEYPRGLLTQKVFESFFGYTRDKNGKLISHPGEERIPDNWYKRSSENQWDTADIALSTAQNCVAYPLSCQVGGNTGTVNSFTGVDLSDISGGLINSAKALEDPDIFSCFITQAIGAEVPGVLEKTFSGAALKAAEALIPKLLKPALAKFGTGLKKCPNLPKGKSIQQYGKPFPGAQFASGGPRSGGNGHMKHGRHG